MNRSECWATKFVNKMNSCGRDANVRWMGLTKKDKIRNDHVTGRLKVAPVRVKKAAG